MKFPQPLVPATLLRRHHRFLVDVRLADGRETTAHTGNTGAMLGCSGPGMAVWLSKSPNPARKYPYSLELVEPAPGQWVGVNTLLPNKLVQEVIEQRRFPTFGDYTRIRPEVRYGAENSRVDFLLRGQGVPDCYLEVKNVTYCQAGRAMFPDAVTERGTRHLRELLRMRQEGYRAAVVFCVQHSEAERFSTAGHIDPLYAQTLSEAMGQGLEVCAWKASMSPEGVEITTELPVDAGRPLAKSQ